MSLCVHRVRGQSMSPHFNHNDYVMSFSWRQTEFCVGDVVVLNHPRFFTIIKRIAEINDQGELRLRGDNPASTPSEEIGWQPIHRVIGKVVWHIQPPSEATPTTNGV